MQKKEYSIDPSTSKYCVVTVEAKPETKIFPDWQCARSVIERAKIDDADQQLLQAEFNTSGGGARYELTKPLTSDQVQEIKELGFHVWGPVRG